MFSQEPHCIYEKNQLAEVICQFRFPTILSLNTEPPVDFQEAVRDHFPQYNSRMENPAPRMVGTPGNISFQKQDPIKNHQFTSADGLWRINLTCQFISLTCSKYASWEDFAKMWDKPLAAFIKIYHPAYFDRVGLRYLNFISRKELGLEGTPYSDLLAPCYLGLMAEEDLPEGNISRNIVESEMMIRGGCRAKIHAGPGMVRRNGQTDQEAKFVFDQDLYMPGQVPVNLAAGALQTLHGQAFSIFRGAITDTLHDAMEPVAD